MRKRQVSYASGDLHQKRQFPTILEGHGISLLISRHGKQSLWRHGSAVQWPYKLTRRMCFHNFLTG